MGSIKITYTPTDIGHYAMNKAGEVAELLHQLVLDLEAVTSQGIVDRDGIGFPALLPICSVSTRLVRYVFIVCPPPV